MSRRRSASVALGPGGLWSVCAVLALTVTVTACGSPVAVEAPDGGTDTGPACRSLTASLPDKVDGQELRDVEPDDAVTAAWGDPPIVLRCGVERPPRLQPTSFCFLVNDIGWYAEDDEGSLDGTTPPQGSVVFTTIGRSPYVEMTVPPDDSRSAVDPLTDVAAAIREHTREDQPCK